MHFTLTVLNGLNMEECLQRAKEHSLKLHPYEFEEINLNPPKFIIGFGGIPKTISFSYGSTHQFVNYKVTLLFFEKLVLYAIDASLLYS